MLIFYVYYSQYKSDIKLFNQTAKAWTEEHANADNVLKKKLKNLMDMGFDEKKAMEALDKALMDEEKAINLLLSEG